MDLKSKIILIYGPTASGKTEFAVKLAKKVKGEIINADSMQVYKELKILTARPLKKDEQNIKHHLYGFKEVKKNFSTGDWINLVIKKIKLIRKKNKIPILVGGTGLYFKSMTEGLVEIPNIPTKVRKQIRALQKKVGQKKFFEKLIKIDPPANIKIRPTDVQRSIRAYEVKLFTKRSLFDWYKKTKSKFKNKDFLKLYIEFPRSELVQRINLRTKKMLESGSILEVKKFLKLRIPSDKSISKAIGIVQIKNLIQNNLSKEHVIEKISIKTRQYAKRQVTWARGNMKDWKKIKPKDLNSFLKKI
jgi:tRNA dimethylallyltransferase